MKAVFVHRYGEPEVLTYQEAPDPTPGPDEVLIRTAIASVNFADIKARRGTDSVTTQLPLIPGHEVVGTIEAVGDKVHTLRMGQRVVAVISSGAYAELVAAPAAFTFSLPETLASEAAAGLVVLKAVSLLPRRWAERYYNLKRWTIMPSGGHFAPMEEPQRLVEDLRAFFRPCVSKGANGLKQFSLCATDERRNLWQDESMGRLPWSLAEAQASAAQPR